MKLNSIPRKTRFIALGLVGLAAIIWIFAPGMIRFNTLIKTCNHPEAAIAAMDTIMIMNTNRVLKADSGYGDLPNVLVNMKPRSVEITSRSMRLIFRGGIFKYGFQLIRTQEGWDYSWYSGWRSRVLHSIRNR